MVRPDFQNLLNVLARRPTEKPVLFDFLIGKQHAERLVGDAWLPESSPENRLRNLIQTNLAAGYDYSWVPAWELGFTIFPGSEMHKKESIGMAECGVIADWASFENYAWPDPEADRWEMVDALSSELPDGMKFLFFSNGGVLENTIKLVGYEPLCMMLADDPALVRAIVDGIGSRLLRFYQRGIERPAVGSLVINDDWGFKTQMFLSPEQQREYIFPWYRRIIEAVHASGRPLILHSCGQLGAIWEDIIEDLKVDGKHSYEDTILPVEEAYETYGSRIAIMGGIDMDFLARATPEEVFKRCRAMVERTQPRSGYALGSGNSIPNYIPAENFDAMRRAALEW